MMKQFIEVLKNNPNHAYDFIANEYYKFSKEELKDITKELLYTIYNNNSKAMQSIMLEEVADELADNYEEEE